jgi:omega-hydroxy-beta-dihydromenaquinone-9 sulfotransferase
MAVLYFDLWTLIRTPILIIRRETGAKRILGALGVWAFMALTGLFSYLCMSLDYLFFPGVRRVRVAAPIFVVGNGRSGTTQMHRLLTGDAEQMSFFKGYELLLPSLVQKRLVDVAGELDRMLLGGRIYRYIRDRHDNGLAEVRQMHDWRMDGSEEDDFILLHNFSASTLITFFPYMRDYLDLFWTDRKSERARRRIIGFYKAALQRQIYAAGSNRIHCCKSPSFTLKIRALREVFPDARFVAMVRNPAEAMPSLEHLMRWYWEKQGCAPALSAEAGELLSKLQIDQYEYLFQALKDVPEKNQFVVHFPDLVGDPRKIVQEIYGRFGLTISPEYAGFLDDQRAKAKAFVSKHEYEKASEEVGALCYAAIPEIAARFGW